MFKYIYIFVICVYIYTSMCTHIHMSVYPSTYMFSETQVRTYACNYPGLPVWKEYLLWVLKSVNRTYCGLLGARGIAVEANKLEYEDPPTPSLRKNHPGYIFQLFAACCTIPYHTIQYYTIPYYTILYYTILYYTILHYTILHYTTLYYTILHYTTLYYTILYSTNHIWPIR